MTSRDPLQSQRQRGISVRHQLRERGDAFYDAPEALLRQRFEIFPRFSGLIVGQNTLEYALLLLLSDDRLFGGDDAIEANRIIRRILEFQDLRPDSETFGNFFWMTHWDRVRDRNAVSFLAPGLAYIWLQMRERLEDSTRQAMERAFEPLVEGVRRHPATWRYSNIFWLNLGALVALSQVLDDASLHQEAVNRFDQWLTGTDSDGLHEYNSPTYAPVTFFGMETAWAWTPDENFRGRIERAIDYLACQFASNFSPIGFPAGAAARAYRRDILWGSGLGSWWAHIKFGTPLRDDFHEPDRPILLPVNYTLYDYLPPEAIRNTARHWRTEEHHDCTRSLGARRTHVITSRYSLASQHLENVGGHSPAPHILLVRRTAAERASVVLAPDETYSRLPCPSFQSCQDGGRVIGRLRCQPTEEQISLFFNDPEFVCEPRILFGPREEIRSVRIGNVDWGGGPVRLEPGQPVAVFYEHLAVGVIVLPVDQSGRPSDRRFSVEWGDDDEMRLRIRLFGGPDTAPGDCPDDALLLFDVSTIDDLDVATHYADWLAEWCLFLDDDNVVHARHPGEPHMRCGGDRWHPDLLGDALHRSSLMTVHPGDLANWVNHGARLGFLGDGE